MKKILGLDLGTNSIGWALVKEAENADEHSEIVRLGVRVNPLTTDEQKNFEEGKSITTNADRTLKRSMRRNLQRYKLRRENLVEILGQNSIITDDTILYEQGNRTTFETLRLRAKAATENVTLNEFARILLIINKKRGYKSNRKFKSSEEDGQIIDSMQVATELYDEDLTPGEYGWRLFERNKSVIPDFYRSDLLAEFRRVWNFQKQFYPEILTDKLFQELQGKAKTQTWAICKEPFGIVGIKREVKGKDLQKENYKWRAWSLEEQLDLEALAIVLQEINGQINSSSGYLGDISDRSKELYIEKMTVGQYLMRRINADPNGSLKNLVFYRQDYLDEFETLWTTQQKFHQELTDELKKEVRDVVIFYQRRLKSQKELISFCEFEGQKVTKIIDGREKTVMTGPRVCPKSSPLFQEFRIWQNLNNLRIDNAPLIIEHKEILFDELTIRNNLKKNEVVKILGIAGKEHTMNFDKIEGNRTMSTLLEAYRKIIFESGHGEFDFSKMPKKRIMETIVDIFSGLNWNTDILKFNSELKGKEYEQQPMFRLWHLLYSYEGDDSKSGNEKLAKKINEYFGFDIEYAKILANVTFEPDYGNLSSKAMRKILPYLKKGYEYSESCEKAGYRHSKASLTKSEIDSKEYKDRLEQLPKNSLRNPVVEKILNQMVNVVNAVIDEYGKPDEIRVELARELKKSKDEREDATKSNRKSKDENDKIREILKTKFGFADPSKTDIVRYKLYQELKQNGYKTLYSGTYIPYNEIFSKKFDIEHILPQAIFFDDSFANKTLETRDINIEKGNMTAYDFVMQKYGEGGAKKYKDKIESLHNDKVISGTKKKWLLTTKSNIPEDFLQRDLRDSQYIAKKAREMLNEVVKYVVSTSGTITARLREDWQLVDVMKELNWDKYDKLGMTSIIERHEGQKVYKIEDWTKRNDHRHHAMDALTIAFTKRSYIQYLNNLNARIPKGETDNEEDAAMIKANMLKNSELNDLPVSERSRVVRYIESNQMRRDSKGKLRFIPPIPLDEFRAEAKKHLSEILVSIKAKNKVVTQNKNYITGKTEPQKTLTPRGQLHLETVYGRIHQHVAKELKVGSGFNKETIELVANPKYKEALQRRLEEFGNDPKAAFTGKNSLEKNPIYLDAAHTQKVPAKVKTVTLEPVYTIRKNIDPKLSVDKVIDLKIKKLLQQRLAEYGGNAQEAFSNLDKNPIWQNKEKGIKIKSVTIKGINNAIALHDKKDVAGKVMLDAAGRSIPIDFVNTGNNHHVAIYRDENGVLQENVVSFMEATSRVNQGLPVISHDYNKDKGWEFVFTMKQNEMFVFPDKENGFDPKEIDLLDEKNYALISPHLFRVQKFSTKDYYFRHHLETTVDNMDKRLRDITWKRISTPDYLQGVIKVRINHIGKIVQTGEY